MSKELVELTTAKTKLEVEKAQVEANKVSLKQTMDAQIQHCNCAVDKARAEFALTEREQGGNRSAKKSIEGLKSTSSLISPELMGESGELLIEDRIRDLFPRDFVEEIKKDKVVRIIFGYSQQWRRLIGKIYFESGYKIV